jgi:XTP/dITP diphosphohydrolase
MVRAEVKKAYEQLKVPCIVEHAGLIFDGYQNKSYPGGLTKPMWNTLGSAFIQETHSANRSATAKAVVAYCDGMQVVTFEGQTHGTISPEPRGNREFYWDTVFIPHENNPGGLTYAEIVDEPSLGLQHKVLKISQSSKAITAFLEWRLTHRAVLWQVSY